MSDTLLLFDPNKVAPEDGAPPPDRVLAGTPINRTWNFEDDGAGLYSGIWEAEPGEWRVDYSEWEFCHILAGHSVLTEEGGAPVELKAGTSFVIRPGFKGTWRVVETTRKLYVIRS
ncbi:cupin [Aureimonas endophytica]|uniref:Cupin n=1 Tax=Aureimonas endophytica TaxID=2027858 RepID=A0A917DZQ1_9HYPH|nr:cupin domain-containing protein [Aureimonas endophytica]GGD86175.1 cupin [Aureimonas endophytica]